MNKMHEQGSAQKSAATHLVVLLHGFWGNPTHLHYLRDTLRAAHPNEDLHVLIPKSNSDNHTYDGVEVGGERITHEVEELIKQLEAGGKKVAKFSIVGYSLGGLIARYIVGLLYKNGVFEKVEPANFTTFATPHLGVRTPKRGYRQEVWNWLGSKLLSVSGQQLYLTDDFRGTGKPLLTVMTEPGSVFMNGLKKFNRRSIYANVSNDPAVPYYTAAMSSVDPFVDLDAIDLHYLPNQDADVQVLLDPQHPASPREKRDARTSEKQTWTGLNLRDPKTYDSIRFYAFLFSFMPIGIPLFFINAGYQTFQSARRVRIHHQGDRIDLKKYSIPLLEDTQVVQDAAVERLAMDGNQQEYLPTPPSESEASENVKRFDASKSRQEALTDRDALHGEGKDTWPTLALKPAQFTMIHRLDQLGFDKFPCHIRIKRAHAAIVVRSSNESFREGKVVCAHWASRFEA